MVVMFAWPCVMDPVGGLRRDWARSARRCCGDQGQASPRLSISCNTTLRYTRPDVRQQRRVSELHPETPHLDISPQATFLQGAATLAALHDPPRGNGNECPSRETLLSNIVARALFALKITSCATGKHNHPTSWHHRFRKLTA